MITPPRKILRQKNDARASFFLSQWKGENENAARFVLPFLF